MPRLLEAVALVARGPERDTAREMSEENVDIVRDAYARYNAGERIPELWFWHPDAEYHAAREDPDSAVHRGIDAIRKQFASWHEAYPDLKVEILEADGKGDQVFLWVRFVGATRSTISRWSRSSSSRQVKTRSWGS
jgi:ketosteroid isomerase-like protein